MLPYSPTPHPQIPLSLNQWAEHSHLWGDVGERGRGDERIEHKMGGGGGTVGERPSLIENRNVTEKAEPLILSYRLNIPRSPIVRFSTKIEKSSEFCLWKHNSEKGTCSKRKPRPERRRLPLPAPSSGSTVLHLPSARSRDSVGKNRPLILKIYPTHHDPGFPMWIL